MWKIGNIEINSCVVLAPMAGITSFGYRHYMKRFGCEVAITEMVSDMGLIYGNDETSRYIDFPAEKYTGVQLFGYDPNNIKKAALISLNKNPNIDFFDVNMGCPVPKVTKTGAGSFLMKKPQLCGKVIKELKSATNLPVTAKIRLGINDSSINFLEVIDELIKGGVDAIAIHARTAKQLYSGHANYELLRDLQNKISVPLIVSGDIMDLDSAIDAMKISKATAVMVARGGVGNPFLIKQINHYFETGEKLDNPTLLEQLDYCLELADELIKEKGENKAMLIYRSIAPKFLQGYPNMKQFKNKMVTQLTTRESLVNIIAEIKEFIKES